MAHLNDAQNAALTATLKISEVVHRHVYALW